MQLYENGVAGIHIMGTTNFTFDATIGEESSSGEGNVGTMDGQQPIEVIIEDSTLVTFNDLRVQSSNGKCRFRVDRFHTHRTFCCARSSGHTRGLYTAFSAVHKSVEDLSCMRDAPAQTDGNN